MKTITDLLDNNDQDLRKIAEVENERKNPRPAQLGRVDRILGRNDKIRQQLAEPPAPGPSPEPPIGEWPSLPEPEPDSEVVFAHPGFLQNTREGRFLRIFDCLGPLTGARLRCSFRVGGRDPRWAETEEEGLYPLASIYAKKGSEWTEVLGFLQVAHSGALKLKAGHSPDESFANKPGAIGGHASFADEWWHLDYIADEICSLYINASSVDLRAAEHPTSAIHPIPMSSDRLALELGRWNDDGSPVTTPLPEYNLLEVGAVLLEVRR